MLPVLHLGPLAIQTPGLIILLGAGLGLTVMERQAARYQVNGGLLYNTVFLGLLAGIVGARLAFAIHYLSAFRANPANLLSLNLSMFEPAWGIIIALVASAFFGWKKHLPLRHTLDAFTSALAVFVIAFHLAQFTSGDAYGAATTLPWAIDLWGAHRHPVQIYEALAAILILWILWPRPGWYAIAGQRFLAFIAMSAGARLFLEVFRGDSVLWDGIRSAQVISWLIMAFCLWILNKLSVTQNREPN